MRCMSTENTANDPLKVLMKESLVKLPFSDFEARTLQRIMLKETITNATKKDNKLAYLFFLMGTVTGLLIAVTFSNISHPVGDIPAETIQFSAQAMVAIFTLLLGNSLLMKFKRYKG